MRSLLLLLCVVASGCAATFTDATKAVVAENAGAWKRIHGYVQLLHTGDRGEVFGKDRAGWLGYVRAQRTNALLLQAKANGVKLTYAEAHAQAGEIDVP